MECPGEVIKPELSNVCYIVKSLKEVISPHVIRHICYAHFHAFLRYYSFFGWG